MRLTQALPALLTCQTPAAKMHFGSHMQPAHLVQALPVVAVDLAQQQEHEEEHQQGVAGQQEAHDGARPEGCSTLEQGRASGEQWEQGVWKFGVQALFLLFVMQAASSAKPP